MTLLAVSLAGGVGAALRAWVDNAVGARAGFPWGTAAVNLSGSLLMGLLAGVASSALDAPWQTVAAVGFLGGYTTFSTAALQVAEMLHERRWRAGVVYGFGSLGAAVALAGLGLWCGAAVVGA